MTISKAFARAVVAEIDRKRALLRRHEQVLELTHHRLDVAQAELDAVCSDLMELDEVVASIQEGTGLCEGLSSTSH